MSKVKSGKVIKKCTEKNSKFKNEEKIKEEIRAILQGQLNFQPKIKKHEQIGVNHKHTKKIPLEHNNLDRLQDKKQNKRKKKKIVSEKITNQVPIGSSDASLTKNFTKKHSRKDEKYREQPPQTVYSSSFTLSKKKAKMLPLRERMLQRLQAARFRYINEQIYTTHSKEAYKIFKEDPQAFTAYHEGYRQQVNKWPINPLDIIIKAIQKLPSTHIIADFGCGDANLAKSVKQEVHSFDLISVNNLVTACDMTHVPLQSSSVDVVVFCLSLMGTNLNDYILEASRVLKVGGILKIAEVESRFKDVNEFIKTLQRFNFKNTWKDTSHNMFCLMDFKKHSDVKNKKNLPTLSLQPCLYKRR